MNLLMRQKNAWVQGSNWTKCDLRMRQEGALRLPERHRKRAVGNPTVPSTTSSLNQSLQEIRKVFFLLRETLRVGNRVIVGFPNFAYINARVCLGIRGWRP